MIHGDLDAQAELWIYWGVEAGIELEAVDAESRSGGLDRRTRTLHVTFPHPSLPMGILYPWHPTQLSTL